VKKAFEIQRKASPREQVANIYKMLAIILGLFGVLHLIPGQKLNVPDGIFNIIVAVIFFLIGEFLKAGKKLVFYLVAIEVVVSLSYSYIVGQGLNIFTVLFGAVTFAWFYKLQKNGEIR
jgi:hypothetical protein